MTALERYEDRAPALAPQDIAVHRLGEWAQSAQAAYGVAEELVKTSFVPEKFRGKPYEATAAILSGLEMGLSPMASLRSFDIIQGQAAPRAITLRAVAQAHGHEMVLETSTATQCKMRGKRAGTHEWQTITWTTDRAKALGLMGNHGWKVQPQAMLVARATSELARLIAADAILGIAYSAEELTDSAVGEPTPAPVAAPPAVNTETGEIVQATAGTKRMTRRKPAPAESEPTPEAPAPVSDDADRPSDGDPLTLSDAQMKKLRALYGDVGIKDAAEQKRTTAALLGLGRIETHSALTVAQASELIDTLDGVDSGFLEFVLDDEGSVIGVSQSDDTRPPHPGDDQ